jgi:hypothetical protein
MTDSYVVGLVDLPGDPATLPCQCGGCEWKGTAAQLVDIEDCGLTPGDPSPAGRCPECNALAYLDREKDRAQDIALQLLAAVRALRLVLVNAPASKLPKGSAAAISTAHDLIEKVERR